MRFLFVDKILQLSPGELVRGIKHITADDTYLYQNNQGRFCFIPSLIGETLGQLAAWNVMYSNDFTLRPVAGIVASASLHRPAYVGETLLLESFIESLDKEAVQYRSVATIDDEVVFTIDGALGPLLPMEDFIDRDLVRQQFTQIYRPGEELPQAFSQTMSGDSSSIAYLAPPMVFDHFFDIVPGVSMMAAKKITGSAAFFPDHFPKKPVLPMTVLLECKLNLARKFLSLAPWNETYLVSELRKIKMNGFVFPGDVVVCQVKLKQKDSEQLILSFRSEVDGKRVCVLDVVLNAKGIR